MPRFLVMKVFGASGGAYFDDILAALEDCYRLNVDAVNLSLGSPAGFTDEDDYTTDTLFVLTDEVRLNAGGHLMKVDYLTGAVTDVGVVSDDRTYSDQGVTLACDNEGVLYTVYYVNGNGCDAGALYTIDKETAYATRVGETGLMPEHVQSMTVDHETDKLYWASYWGLYMQGCGLIRDDYTGTVYSIWDESDIPGDNSGGHSQLVILNTNNPDITKLGLIGDGVVVNSLFIR